MGAEAPEVYRDAWLLVVDKPAGLPTQATRTGEPGVYEQLCATEAYVGLHHRLDRNASGLVLFTLDRAVNAAVSALLQSRTLQRTYRAKVEGDATAGTWTWPVGGKTARTDVAVVASAGGRTELECVLHTGRTHQIRIHAAMNGTPIVGDTRYGGDLTHHTGRLALHAWRLALTHPASGEPLALTTPVPWALD